VPATETDTALIRPGSLNCAAAIASLISDSRCFCPCHRCSPAPPRAVGHRCRRAPNASPPNAIQPRVPAAAGGDWYPGYTAAASGGRGRLVEQPNPAQPGDQISRPTAADAEPLGGDGSGDPRLGSHQPDDLRSTEPPLLRRRPLLLRHRHAIIHLIQLIA
jgi:hypothetical protein